MRLDASVHKYIIDFLVSAFYFSRIVESFDFDLAGYAQPRMGTS